MSKSKGPNEAELKARERAQAEQATIGKKTFWGVKQLDAAENANVEGPLPDYDNGGSLMPGGAFGMAKARAIAKSNEAAKQAASNTPEAQAAKAKAEEDRKTLLGQQVAAANDAEAQRRNRTLIEQRAAAELKRKTLLGG